MTFITSETNRGFMFIQFHDTYGELCSVQESSAIHEEEGNAYIWVGVHDPKPIIMASDAMNLGIDISNYKNGWIPYEIPSEALISSRMHLDKDAARRLGRMLLAWSKDGRVGLLGQVEVTNA